MWSLGGTGTWALGRASDTGYSFVQLPSACSVLGPGLLPGLAWSPAWANLAGSWTCPQVLGGHCLCGPKLPQTEERC